MDKSCFEKMLLEQESRKPRSAPKQKQAPRLVLASAFRSHFKTKFLLVTKRASLTGTASVASVSSRLCLEARRVSIQTTAHSG